MVDDLFDMGEIESPSGPGLDVQPPELDLNLLIDLLNNDTGLTLRERIELTQKVTVMQKNVAQTKRADTRDAGDQVPGVIVVPAKLPLGEWEEFAIAEVNGARAARGSGKRGAG